MAVEDSTVRVLLVDGHLVTPVMELAPWYLHLGMLCNKQLAAVSQEHGGGQASETNSWPIGALSVGCGQYRSIDVKESYMRADSRRVCICTRS